MNEFGLDLDNSQCALALLWAPVLVYLRDITLRDPGSHEPCIRVERLRTTAETLTVTLERNYKGRRLRTFVQVEYSDYLKNRGAWKRRLTVARQQLAVDPTD